MGTYDEADREPAETAAWIVREWREARCSDRVLVIAITEALKVLPAAVKDLERDLSQLRATLASIRAYAEDRVDADCVGDPPQVVGNDWNTVVNMIDALTPHTPDGAKE